MKTKMMFLVLCLCLGMRVFGQMDSLVQSLTQRIVLLEGEKGIREGELKVQTDQLRTDFNALKSDSESLSMRIWIAIVFGLGFLGLSVFGILKFAKAHAQRLVQSKLDNDLPPLVQKGMEESFDRLLRKNSQTVLDVVGKYNRIEEFKHSKRLLILCEDKPDCEKMRTLVKDMGFDHVEARVAHDFEATENFDLVIIAREDADLTKYKLLDGNRIWDYLASLPNDRVVLYYGPRFERLDAEVREKIHFSNIVFTIYARILEVFEYQFVLEEKAKSIKH